MAMIRLLPVILLSLFPGTIPAQTITITPIQVGVIESPPFAMRDAAGVHSGMAVDLFRLAAEELGLSARFVPALEPRAALADGASVVLPVEASASLEAELDLTHPVYTATLGAASESESRILAVVRGLASLEFLRLVVGLSILLLLVGAAVWAVERRRNGDMFHERPLRGLGDGFWWAGVTLTTIGYGDKAPATFWGRALAMLWMLVGLAVSASLTAAVVTLADTGRGGLSLPTDLQDRNLVVIEGGTGADYAAREGLPAQVMPDAEAALSAVEAGDAEVALGPSPILRHAAEGTGLTVTTTRIDPVLIAFAVATGDPLREDLNRALLRIVTSEMGQAVARRYLADE